MEKGKRSSRLAPKPTAGMSTMDKVKIVLLKKSGEVLLEEPGAADLARYDQLYDKPVSANFIDAVTALVTEGLGVSQAAA